MKVFIETDEWYPVYSISEFEEDYTDPIELTGEEFNFILKATQDFVKAQNIIKKAQDIDRYGN